MVYLDSNVFVYAVTHDPAKNSKARSAIRVLREVEENTVHGVTSLLTWDEIGWVVWKLKGPDAGVATAAAFMKLRNLSLSTVNLAVMLRAQELIERYRGLKPRDSIHVATALLAGEREIISDDSDLDVVRVIKRVGL